MSDPEHPIVIAPATVIAPPVVDVPRTSEHLSPSTTLEEDRKTAGQREINLIWENTQMKLALSVIWTSLAVGGCLAVFGAWLGTADVQLAAVVFLFGVANLVTGFYFGRTNHQRSGGIGGDSAGPR